MPRVSVVIPSYNHEKYVAEAIRSVLDQTYQDFEIVISDDGSTDGTVGVIEGFRDTRIRLFRHKRNHGQFAAMRRCIEEAEGEYIAVLNSDDAFQPDKLEKQVDFLDTHKEVAAVFSYAAIIDEDGSDFVNETHPYHRVFIQPNRTRHEWLNHFFYKGNCLCHPSVLIRSECHRTIGHYNELYANFSDFDFWVRLCLKHDIHVIPENLVRFRIREGEANMGARRPDVTARSAWELAHILENFLLINNVQDLHLIFPKARRFGEMLEEDLIPYYIAMLAMDISYAPYQLFGLNTLSRFMEDPYHAQKLSELLSFAPVNFLTLTGSADALNFKNLLERDNLIKSQEERLAFMEQAVRNMEQAVRDREQAVRDRDEQITGLKAIEDSFSWKLVRRLLDGFDYRIFPHYTRRSRIFRPMIMRLVSLMFPGHKASLLLPEPPHGLKLRGSVEHYEPRGDQKTTWIRKVSFLVTPFDEQSKRYRVYNLIEGLTERGIECFVFQETDADMLDLFLDSDIFIIFRTAYSDIVGSIIQKMRERNVPVIFDIDDLIFDRKHLWSFAGLNTMTPEEQKRFKDGISRWRATLLESDYVTCTTDTIAHYANQYGKDTFVIKNTINTEQLSLSDELIKKKRYAPGETLRIGYLSGTHTHNRDFLEVSGALYQIMKNYPFVEFHLVGHLDLPGELLDFKQRIYITPLMPYPAYLEYLARMDVNLAPLELNNPFTDAKSELKIFEAALMGVPTVASPTASYRDCITDGADGFLAATEEEWYNKLSLMVEDASLREKIAQHARKSFLDRYYIKNVVDDVVRLYERVLDHYRAAHPRGSRVFTLPDKLPMFSIVSILYRKEDQVVHFLKSFMRQSYQGSFEIIFVDDRSPDNSAKAVQDFVTKVKEEGGVGTLPSVRVVRNDKNMGNCVSRNIGIKHARGEIIVIIDADCIVNGDFLNAHAESYAYKDCDAAIGPLNLETDGRPPFAVLDAYEKDAARVARDAQPQDPLNERSFLNCITRNFSIRKEYIEEDLFDVSFSYSEDGESGFGWEDIEMGYRLYTRGARIKFAADAFSLHVSHPSSVDEKTKPLRSLKNFRKLYEKHPELLLVARRWTLDTYQKICQWADHHQHAKNDDRRCLDNLFQRFQPAPFFIGKAGGGLRILTYRWHCSHQYELYKLPHKFTLVKGTGTPMTDSWEYDKRPLPENAEFRSLEEIKINEYDLAILHFDENVLAPENTNNIIKPEWHWGDTFKWFVKNITIPKIAICHGTPQFYGQYNAHYKKPNLMQVMENERRKIIDFVGDMLIITNSHQAQREWNFKYSKVIWHGFDPAEFHPSTYHKGILMMLKRAMTNRPHYNGYFIYEQVFKNFPEKYSPTTLSVPEPHASYKKNSNAYAYAKFHNYVDTTRRFSIYFNPSLRSPMPRSRGEAMICGLAIVSTNNHDVEMFIKNGLNGFYSNDPGELREYLLYLTRNPEKTRKMGMAGRELAMDIFNHDRYLQEWENTISEMLK